jgi:hypothetical protein
MAGTSLKRLLGIGLIVPSIFFLYVMYQDNAIVRGKGFTAPLFDREDVPALCLCAVLAAVGAWLFVTGRRRTAVSSSTQPKDQSVE